MKNNENKTIKLEDLEVETIYKDEHGQFFKFFYDDSISDEFCARF